LQALRQGCVGTISASINLTCALAQGIYGKASQDPDAPGLDDAQEHLFKVRKTVESFALPGIKAQLAKIHNQPSFGDVLPPFLRLSDEQAAAFDLALEDLGYSAP